MYKCGLLNLPFSPVVFVLQGTDTKSKSVHDLTVELSDLFGNAHWSFSAVVPDETPKAATGKSHSSGQKKRSLTQRVGPFGGGENRNTNIVLTGICQVLSSCEVISFVKC